MIEILGFRGGDRHSGPSLWWERGHRGGNWGPSKWRYWYCYFPKDVWMTPAMPFKPRSQPLHWHSGESVIPEEARVMRAVSFRIRRHGLFRAIFSFFVVMLKGVWFLAWHTHWTDSISWLKRVDGISEFIPLLLSRVRTYGCLVFPCRL